MMSISAPCSTLISRTLSPRAMSTHPNPVSHGSILASATDRRPSLTTTAYAVPQPVRRNSHEPSDSRLNANGTRRAATTFASTPNAATAIVAPAPDQAATSTSASKQPANCAGKKARPRCPHTGAADHRHHITEGNHR